MLFLFHVNNFFLISISYIIDIYIINIVVIVVGPVDCVISS